MDMSKRFNVSADCKPDLHYMVDIKNRLVQIRKMIENGDYFTINRARQYGKTTMLKALNHFLLQDYMVISLDFQKISFPNFGSEDAFVKAVSKEIVKKYCKKDDYEIPLEIKKYFHKFSDGIDAELINLFHCFSEWCGQSDKPVVLMIDEVDSAADNQVFMDFLAYLRGYYIDRDEMPTFQSVILAGVYDIKNIKYKLHSDNEYKRNSPWNIAADFLVDMSFSVQDIAGMLAEYENDYKTGMNIELISKLIYDYTSGYPFLVSRICKLIDERITGSQNYFDRKAAWTKAGILEAVKLLLSEKNTLFESLVNKLIDYPQLKKLIYSILFEGKEITYNTDNYVIDIASMFGFVKNVQGILTVSNRVFEIRLYNLFLSEEENENQMFLAGITEKNQFIQNGRLNMREILRKFVVHWEDLYNTMDEKFIEDNGRKFFLLYLKPIINGTGNYYIESQTRNNRRTDVIVDYKGEQFVIEMKIWRGEVYHKRGELQLSEYLEYYHLKEGYMISFNFNKKKQTGVREIKLGDKILIEAVV